MAGRLTELRQTVLAFLNDSDKPLTAKTIHRLLMESVDLSSVYRALEFLEEKRLLHSVSFSDVRFFYAETSGGHGHFLYCRNCGEIREFRDCAVGTMQRHIETDFGFAVERHTLCFEGLCAVCFQAERKRLDTGETL